MGYFSYSEVAGDNSVVGGVTISENNIQIPALNDAIRAMIADSAKLMADLGGTKISGSTATNAYTFDISSDPTAYNGYMFFRIKADHTNTAASTGNVESLGVKTIKKLFNGTSIDLVAGDYPTNHIGEFVYSTVDACLILLNPVNISVGNVKVTYASNIATFAGATSGYIFDGPLIGGTAVGAKLELKSTTGVGTTDYIRALVGNNGATEGWRVDNNGKFLTGLTTAQVVGGNSSQVQIRGGASDSILLGKWSADAVGAALNFVKSRNATPGSNTIVQNADEVGIIAWYMDDGTDYATPLAAIQAIVDGTPGANDAPGRLVFYTTTNGANALSEGMRLTDSKNLKIGGTADRATTEGTKHLDIFNGTAPAGTLANGISLFAASGELRVLDAAGNNSLLSPHDKQTNEWIFDSVDTTTGKHLRIDVERMLRFINDKFGLDAIKEFTEQGD